MSHHALLEDRRAYQRQWVDKNREKMRAYLRAYSRKKQAERVASRPPAIPCSCGNTTCFRWKDNQWHCSMPACVKARRRKNKSRKRSGGARLRRAIVKKYQRLCARYGQPMADAFKFLMEGQSRITIPLWKVIRQTLPAEYHHHREGIIWRIELLNLVTGQPVWAIGWQCKGCGLRSDDHRFFDIDHILPKCKEGHDCVENMQVLCPNCHRTKTISDLRERHNPSPEQLDPPAQDHWQAGTVTTINVGAESNTPPTVSTTSLNQQ